MLLGGADRHVRGLLPTVDVLIRLPMHVEADVRKLAATVEEMESMYGEGEYSRDALAEYLGWDDTRLDDIWSHMGEHSLRVVRHPSF